jgi:tetratricopeptide (TPR) repeat protein
MINKILVFIGICSGLNVYGTSVDSSLYSSDFERKVFRQITQSVPVDSIDLFLALDFVPSPGKEKVQRFVKELKTRVDQYPVNKRLKTIYKSVHDEFLTKYTEEAYFKDIFINGNYNCVSASALYALVLQEMNIKFLIKETPVHVYLIADPEHTAFLIESTLPGERIIRFDERTKTNYIEYLHNNKMISDEEFRSSTIDELFEDHYSKDKTISLKELAGIQYYNRGVFQFNKSDYAGSLLNFEKAVFLNPDEMIKYMRNNALLNVLNLEHQKKTYDGHTLARYVNSNDSNSLGLQYGIDYFNAVSGELIVNRPNIGAYRNYFRQLSSSIEIQDTAELYRIYYFFLGYNECVNYRYSQALSYLSRAYDLNPDNSTTKQLISESVIKFFYNDREHDRTIDSLNNYLARFPYLQQDKNLIGYLEYCYAKSIENHFSSENFVRGSLRLRNYEDFLHRYKDFEANKEYIVMIYRQIGLYYMLTDQNDQAEQILRKGIRIVPEAEVLKELLQNIIRMKGGSYEYPELMSDTKPIKKYLMAIAKAKDNIEIINENAGKYLVRVWKLSKVITGGSEKNAPPEMGITMNLSEDNKIEYITGGEKKLGIWNYNKSKCLLDLMMDGENHPKHIVITEILPGRLKGVMYEQDDYEGSSELIFTSDI